MTYDARTWMGGGESSRSYFVWTLQTKEKETKCETTTDKCTSTLSCFWLSQSLPKAIR